eukprot:CAMPEP_0170295856 /NCGR_PEP_ID=MMETSP0116_2-20130129/48057_1 /TAXON_ID=400756 /ORGANISM="Durinskia baltica, Strain CSIRO CS-38" /LENGTH=61 /DNA_ID=CAMNT_0010547417 /DNA_START=29 /DNA_END=214 /DNA_ORIENTATION=+
MTFGRLCRPAGVRCRPPTDAARPAAPLSGLVQPSRPEIVGLVGRVGVNTALRAPNGGVRKC